MRHTCDLNCPAFTYEADPVAPNSSIASFLFPLFASYKALKTSDPAQLTPWLMYWVVLACALLVESWTEWFLVWYVIWPRPFDQVNLPT